MKKIENAEIIGFKSWKAKDKEYKIIAVTYTEADTAGKMCGTIFVSKSYQVGTKITVIQHQGRLFIIE